MSRTIRFVGLIAVVLLGNSARAATNEAPAFVSKLGNKVESYIEKNRLVKRVVEVPGLEGVQRIFVPIITQAHDREFRRRFNQRSNVVLWAQNPDIDYYAKLIVDSRTHYWREFKDREFTVVTKPQKDAWESSRYIALELSADHIKGLQSFFRTVDTPSKWKAKNPRRELKAGGGGCMWWLTSAEIGGRQALATALGVSRSSAPENLRARMMHSANARVSVIGVRVGSLAAFKRMTQEKLMGPAPLVAQPPAAQVTQ